MHGRLILFVVIGLGFFAKHTCGAQPHGLELWGARAGSSASIELRPIDASTGQVGVGVQFGDGLARSVLWDLASDTARQPQVVWALRGATPANELVSLNPYSGLVLTLNLLDAPTTIAGLAIDPTDGVMYGVSADTLYTIDPLTAATTLVGLLDTPIATGLSGLGFSQQGVLLGASSNGTSLVAIDKETAVTSTVATLPFSLRGDLASDPISGQMYAFGFDRDYKLYRIDPSDGAFEEIGVSLSRPSGLAFTIVPEPAGMALAATVLAVAGFAARGGRRKVR